MPWDFRLPQMDVATTIADAKLLALEDDCDGSCQTYTVARLSAAGCRDARVIPTLRTASTRCQTSSAKDWGGDKPVLFRVPSVQAVAVDMMVMIEPGFHGSGGDKKTAAVVGKVPWEAYRINQAEILLDNITTTAGYPS